MKKFLLLFLLPFLLIGQDDFWAPEHNVHGAASFLGTVIYAADGDTLKIDMGTALYVLDIEIDNSRIFGVDSLGNVILAADLTISGDNLFMATNTSGFILRADGTNYSPISFVNSSDLSGFIGDEVGTIYLVYSDSPAFTTSILPAVAGATNIGTAALEWGDIYQGDDKKHYFGLDQDFSMEYDEDGNDLMIFAGTDINMSGKYFLNEQGRTDHVSNTMPIPYYSLNGINNKISIPSSTEFDLGTGDYSGIFTFRMPPVISGDYTIFGRAVDVNNRFQLQYRTGGTNDLALLIKDTGNTISFSVTTDGNVVLVANTIYTVAFVIDRDVGNYIYLNAVSESLVTDTKDDGANTHSYSAPMDFGYLVVGTVYSELDVLSAKFFNKALTAAEVIYYYTGGSVTPKYQGASQTLISPVSDDAGVDNTANWTDINGALTHAASEYTYTVTTGASVSSFTDEGSLTVGKRYRATVMTKDGTGTSAAVRIRALTNADAEIQSGSVITTGAAYAIATVEWTATETNNKVQIEIGATSVSDGQTILFDTIEMLAIGAVAEYDGSTMTASTWYDKQNDLDGTVTGASLENKVAALVITDYLDVTGTIQAKIFSGGAPEAQSITAVTNTINAEAALHYSITADNDYVMTSTPTIPDGVDGQILFLHNSGTNTIDLQDENILAGSNILLNGAESEVHVDGLMTLIFSSSESAWLVVSNPNTAQFGANATLLSVRNISGTSIAAGMAVYITGFNTGLNRPTIGLADADDSAKMPAIGITAATIANGANGEVIMSGNSIGNINTSAASVDDGVWLSTTAGEVVFTRPVVDEIQRIGTVTKSAVAGNILVTGAGRANDIPIIITVGGNSGTSGSITWIASDNDQGVAAINTSDALLFTGFSGGYSFDAAVTIDGDLTFTGTQILATSTGQLDIKTLAGDGDIVLTPHGTGDVNITKALLLSEGSQNYLFTDQSNSLILQGQTAALYTELSLMSKDGDATDDVAISIYGKGFPGSVTNSERLQLTWVPGNSAYEIKTNKSGTGTLHPLVLYTEGNSDQLKLNIDGSSSFGAALDVVGAFTANTIASDGVLSGTTITASVGFALGDGDYIGVTGNEVLVFNTAGTIKVEGADFYVGETAADNVLRSFNIVGDADADGGVTVSETFTLSLTQNVTPTLATWAFTTSQGAGYTFDKDISVPALEKFIFDGDAGHTYWAETADDVASLFVGDVEAITVKEGTNVIVGIQNPNLEVWQTSWAVLQLGGVGILTSQVAEGAGNSMVIGNNVYIDATSASYQRQVNDEATIYHQTNGEHVFQVADAQNPDVDITWTIALTIENDGDVDITSGVLLVSGSPIDSDDLSDVSSIAMLNEAETIASNWDNTANPWADNEVVDALTISGGTVNNSVIGASDPAAGTFDNVIANSNYVLEGYSTGRNILRALRLNLENATTGGNYVKATGLNQWNASAIAEEDDLELGTTGSRFFYGSGFNSHIFEILASALDGTAVGILSVDVTFNSAGSDLVVDFEIVSGNLRLTFRTGASGAVADLDLLLDTGSIILVLLYITSS